MVWKRYFNGNHTWNFGFGFSSFPGLVLCSPAFSSDAGQGSHSPASATWSQRWLTDALTAILDQETTLLFPFERLLLVKENRASQVKELSACLCVGGCGVWMHWSQSSDLHLSSRGHCPMLSCPDSPQGSPLGQLGLGGHNILCSLAWQQDCPLAGVVNAFWLVMFTVYHGFVVVA